MTIFDNAVDTNELLVYIAKSLEFFPMFRTIVRLWRLFFSV